MYFFYSIQSFYLLNLNRVDLVSFANHVCLSNVPLEEMMSRV